MKTETIKTPDFMGRINSIIAEARTKTCIDVIDPEVIVEILKDSLNEYCTLLKWYYKEEYDIAISSARNSAYDDGFEDGYDVGYDVGHSDCNTKNH